MGQTKTTTRQLNNLLWSIQITKRNEISMYKTIVEGIRLYGGGGADLWEVNKRKFRIQNESNVNGVLETML